MDKFLGWFGLARRSRVDVLQARVFENLDVAAKALEDVKRLRSQLAAAHELLNDRGYVARRDLHEITKRLPVVLGEES